MTIDKLISRLEEIKKQVGGSCEVLVVDGDGEYGFSLHAEPIEDTTGNVLVIDTTGDPE